MTILLDLNAMATESFLALKFRYAGSPIIFLIIFVHLRYLCVLIKCNIFPSQEILNVECSRRYTTVRKYSEVVAAAAVRVCLPFTDLKRFKMVHMLEFFLSHPF
jgi:hypothetical protein